MRGAGGGGTFPIYPLQLHQHVFRFRGPPQSSGFPFCVSQQHTPSRSTSPQIPAEAPAADDSVAGTRTGAGAGAGAGGAGLAGLQLAGGPGVEWMPSGVGTENFR